MLQPLFVRHAARGDARGQHRRIDVARADAVDTDIVLGVIDGHGAGHLHDGAFAGAIGEGVAAADETQSDAMLTMVPPPRARIRRTAARLRRNTAVMFTATISSHSTSLQSPIVPR